MVKKTVQWNKLVIKKPSLMETVFFRKNGNTMIINKVNSIVPTMRYWSNKLAFSWQTPDFEVPLSYKAMR